MKLSACIEWLFSDETNDLAERIHLAHRAGLDAVEFWLWNNKDLNAIAGALEETGIALTGFVAEPMLPLTDPDNKEKFLAGLQESITVAQRLGAKILIAQAGDDLEGMSRLEQRKALVECLKAAAGILEGTSLKLGMEPLNTLIDHKGYYLGSTKEAIEIINEVDRPEIGIVYDLYHSYVMGEAIEDVLRDGVHHIVHAHVADHPGRNDPGQGEIDFSKRLGWLFSNGYEGAVGLEYKPAANTGEGLEHVRQSLGGSRI